MVFHCIVRVDMQIFYFHHEQASFIILKQGHTQGITALTELGGPVPWGASKSRGGTYGHQGAKN